MSGIAIRKASDPFVIPLQPKAIEAIMDHKKFAGKRWYWPDIRVLAFSKGKLRLQSSDDDKSFTQLLIIDKHQLQLSCTCAMPVSTICVHLYRVLQQASRFSLTDFLRQFAPGGAVQLAIRYKKHFNLRYNGIHPDIDPKLQLGTIYSLPACNDMIAMQQVLSMPAAPAITAQPKKVISYFIVHFNSRSHLPYIVPCQARLYNAGTAVKWFDKFLSGLHGKDDISLTDEQELLNQYCFRLCKEAEKLGGSFHDNQQRDGNSPVDYEPYFSLLQKIVPLLSIQHWVFSYRIYAPRLLKRRPIKQRAFKVAVDPQPATLYFRLIQKKDMQQLLLVADSKGKPLAAQSLHCPFFIAKEGSMQLLSTVKDACLADWMRSSQNCITVFKEYTADFQKSILKKLKTEYSVAIVKK